MKKTIIGVLLMALCLSIFAQENVEEINKNEDKDLEHYMPIYLDAPAELNVKKGYKELNVAVGFANFKKFYGVKSIIEFDFAPIDKLGFEIEIPFTYVQDKKSHTAVVPTGEELVVAEEGSSLESAMALRIGFNYTVFSSKKAHTSVALGYFNELESSPFKHFDKPFIVANVYNPFILIGNVWGKKQRIHTMFYAGPVIKHEFEAKKAVVQVRINPNFSYRVGKGKNQTFLGLENNLSIGQHGNVQFIFRPQAQIAFNDSWKLGLVLGVPVKTNNDHIISGFMRLIFNPK